MYRDIDPPRPQEHERPDISRGGRGGADVDRLPPERDYRDVFLRDLALPQGPERERVRHRDRDYELRGSETRLLTTVGALRVVNAADLREPDQSARAAEHDIERLRDAGLVDTFTAVVDGQRATVLTLSEDGLDLLESVRREERSGPEQTFHAGPATPRELQHDLKVLHAYRVAADDIRASGGRVRRVVLERDLKREYQQFLQAPNRERRSTSGRPARDAVEIARWAAERQLPEHDGHVQFPDARLEYERADGRVDVRDLEVVTPHYRGAHAAAKARSGFSAHRATGARISAGHQSGRGGRGPDPRLAEDLLR
jgi:DNA-binding transcriptional ArsR family regulator